MADPGFDHDLKPLFREKDRDAMLSRFDLWACADVRANATPILTMLKAGGMPCDGAWPEDRIELFEQWTQTGMKE
jgi:hypothetical protein